ncbi:MAG TPA: ribonuclease D [Gammaproteobacteria bacterium]|nr:ribonuclease D [Gammaproteobacteria bacterium]
MTDKYINTQKDLAELCQELASSPWLAIDTEFIREKTYYPQLCLIQIGAPGILACVDTLAIKDLGCFFELIANPNSIKVFHAAGQDLEIFYHLNGSLPQPVFDTQLAAAFLGHGEQIGYANLVKELLKVQLEKTHTRTDWSRRPLSPGQIEYALDDVRYLRDIYLMLRQALIATRRLSWVEEDSKYLTQPERYRPDPDNAWQRIKAVNKLRGVKLNVLRHLAAWREHEAMAVNKPKRWVLSDDLLLQLAQQTPKQREEFGQLRDLSAGTAERYADTLLALIGKALQEPKELWPETENHRKPSMQQEATADMVNAALRIKAAEHSISPQLLATREHIHNLLSGERDIPLLQGWRLELAGQTVLDVMAGKQQLAYVDNAPTLIPK